MKKLCVFFVSLCMTLIEIPLVSYADTTLENPRSRRTQLVRTFDPNQSDSDVSSPRRRFTRSSSRPIDRFSRGPLAPPTVVAPEVSDGSSVEPRRGLRERNDSSVESIVEVSFLDGENEVSLFYEGETIVRGEVTFSDGTRKIFRNVRPFVRSGSSCPVEGEGPCFHIPSEPIFFIPGISGLGSREVVENDGTRIMTTEYDYLGQLYSVIDPTGSETSVVFDSDGNITDLVSGEESLVQIVNEMQSQFDGMKPTQSMTLEKLDQLDQLIRNFRLTLFGFVRDFSNTVTGHFSEDSFGELESFVDQVLSSMISDRNALISNSSFMISIEGESFEISANDMGLVLSAFNEVVNQELLGGGVPIEGFPPSNYLQLGGIDDADIEGLLTVGEKTDLEKHSDSLFFLLDLNITPTPIMIHSGWQSLGEIQKLVLRLLEKYGDMVLESGQVSLENFKKLLKGEQLALPQSVFAIPANAEDGGFDVNVLDWELKEGLENYRIYRKAYGDSSFELVSELSGVVLGRFMDDVTDDGINYAYEIRGVYGNGEETEPVDFHIQANYEEAYEGIQSDEVLALVHANHLNLVDIGEEVEDYQNPFLDGKLDPITEGDLAAYLGYASASELPWVDSDGDGESVLLDWHIIKAVDGSILAPLGFYYAMRRNLPKENIIFIHGIESTEERGAIPSHDIFQNNILDPVYNHMVDQNILNKITTLVSFGLSLDYQSFSFDRVLQLYLTEKVEGTYDGSFWSRFSQATLFPGQDLLEEGRQFSRALGDVGYMITRIDSATPENSKRMIDDSIWAEQNYFFNDADWISQTDLQAFVDWQDFNGYVNDQFRLAGEMISDFGYFGSNTNCNYRIEDECDAERFGFSPHLQSAFVNSHSQDYIDALIAAGTPIEDLPRVYDGDNDGKLDNVFYRAGWYEHRNYQDYYEWARGAIGWNLDSAVGMRYRSPDLTGHWGSHIINSIFDDDGNLVRRGAAASMSAVNEPYVSGHGLPAHMTHMLFAGYSFGELAIERRNGTGQPNAQYSFNGDPIYRPFGVHSDRQMETVLDEQGVIVGYREVHGRGFWQDDDTRRAFRVSYRQYDLSGRLTKEQKTDGAQIHYLDDGRTVFISASSHEGQVVSVYDLEGLLLSQHEFPGIQLAPQYQVENSPGGSLFDDHYILFDDEGEILIKRTYRNSDREDIFDSEGRLVQIHEETVLSWDMKYHFQTGDNAITLSQDGALTTQRLNRADGSYVILSYTEEDDVIGVAQLQLYDSSDQLIATISKTEEQEYTELFEVSFEGSGIHFQNIEFVDDGFNRFGDFSGFFNFPSSALKMIKFIDFFKDASLAEPGVSRNVSIHHKALGVGETRNKETSTFINHLGNRVGRNYAQGYSISSFYSFTEFAGSGKILTSYESLDNRSFEIILDGSGNLIDFIYKNNLGEEIIEFEIMNNGTYRMTERTTGVAYADIRANGTGDLIAIAERIITEMTLQYKTWLNRLSNYLRRQGYTPEGGSDVFITPTANIKTALDLGLNLSVSADGVLESFAIIGDNRIQNLHDGTISIFGSTSSLGFGVGDDLIQQILLDGTIYHYGALGLERVVLPNGIEREVVRDGYEVVGFKEILPNGIRRVYDAEENLLGQSVGGVLTLSLSPDGLGSIFHAMGFVENGDIIELGAGTYNQDSNFPINKAVTIRAAQGAEVIIDGSQVTSGLGWAHIWSNVTLEGLIFRNWNITSKASTQSYETVGVISSDRYNRNSVTINIIDSVFENNTNTRGGGVVALHAVDANISGSVFRNNNLSGFSNQKVAPLRVLRTNLTVSNTVFEGNQVTNGAAGVFAQSIGQEHTVTIDQLTRFENNILTGDGSGAVHLWEVQAEIRDSSFINNSAREWGAIFSEDTDLTLDGNLFDYLFDPLDLPEGFSEVIPSSIVQIWPDRRSFSGSGGVYSPVQNQDNSQVSIENSEFRAREGTFAIHLSDGIYSWLGSSFSRYGISIEDALTASPIIPVQLMENTFNLPLDEALYVSETENVQMYDVAIQWGIFNVQDYGAVGDGVTDDTQAIRDALAAAELAGGGTIYLPAGTYRVFGRSPGEYVFQIRGSNITFEGEGPENTVISAYGYNNQDPNEPILNRGGVFDIVLGVDDTPVSDITFSNLRVTGNADVTEDAGLWWTDEQMRNGWDVSHKALAVIGDVDNILIENTEWDHFRGEILYSGGARTGDVVIRDTVVHNSNASSISMSGNVLIERVEIYDVYQAIENFALGNEQRTVIRDSIIEPNRDNPYDIGENGVTYLGRKDSELILENNSISNATLGVFLSEFAHNVTIDNNTFTDVDLSIYAIFLAMQPYSQSYNLEHRGYTNVSIQNNDFIAESQIVHGLVTYGEGVAVRDWTMSHNNLIIRNDLGHGSTLTRFQQTNKLRTATISKQTILDAFPQGETVWIELEAAGWINFVNGDETQAVLVASEAEKAAGLWGITLSSLNTEEEAMMREILLSVYSSNLTKQQILDSFLDGESIWAELISAGWIAPVSGNDEEAALTVTEDQLAIGLESLTSEENARLRGFFRFIDNIVIDNNFVEDGGKLSDLSNYWGLYSGKDFFRPLFSDNTVEGTYALGLPFGMYAADPDNLPTTLSIYPTSDRLLIIDNHLGRVNLKFDNVGSYSVGFEVTITSTVPVGKEFIFAADSEWNVFDRDYEMGAGTQITLRFNEDGKFEVSNYTSE